MDALDPYIQALPQGAGVAVKACRDGVESTKGMKAKLGRSVYVMGESNDNGEKWHDIPDPGAWGVLAVVCGLSDTRITSA